MASKHDPNDWRLVEENAFGIRYAPLTTREHVRIGSRERVLNVACKHPDKLIIELNALVTRILFDDKNRATGVEYLKGERLYQAHANPSGDAGRKVSSLRFARDDNLRRSIQHTTASDAFRYRAEGENWNARHQSSRRTSRVSAGISGPLRSQRRQPHESGLESLAGAKFDNSDPQYRRVGVR